MQSSISLNPVDTAIGRTVREKRVLQHKSVAETADALCISQTLYTMCEAGELAFQAGDLFTLADFFGMRARDLMPTKDELAHVDSATRYGDPQEVRDLIYYFSGVVSPSLRGFFLRQIEDASTQGQRDLAKQSAGVHAFPTKKKQVVRKPGRGFGFLRAS
jgi:transcriptional regulator with XRE-family HTH domain